MKITSLKSTGVKGQNIDMAPRAVNVIVGPNYSGKSAVKNSVELTLLGYIPGLGKKNPSIFELSNGEPIDVLAAFDNDTALRRTWKRSGKSIKAEAKGEFEVPPVMLDLGALFGMTKSERQEYLFRLAQTGELSWESITAAVKSVAVVEPTEETETALNNVIELINSAEGGEVPERLQNALTLIKDQTKIVNQEVKDHEGFTRTVTRQSELEVPVNNARAKVKAARDEVEKAAAEVTKWQNALREYEAKATKLKSLEDEPGADVSELDKTLAELVGQISDAEVLLETLNAQLEEMQPEAVNKNFGELSAKVATLTAEYNAIARRGKELTEQRANAVVRAKNILNKNELNYLDAHRQIIKDADVILKKRDEFAAYDICPTCATPGETWKVDLLAAYDKNLEELYARDKESQNRKIESDKQVQRDMETELDGIDEQIVECSEELESKLKEGREARKAKEGAAAIVSACNAKREEACNAQNALNKLNYERQTFTIQRQEIVEKSAARLASIENLRKELDASDAVDYEAEIDKSRDCEDAAREKLAEADKELQQETANMAKALEMQKSIVRRRIAEAELEILKGSSKVLLELQKETIEKSFEPLLETARKFTDGILKAPLAFHDGDLGYWDKSTFVTHRTFSGTEEALAYAGLMIALASASGAPLKVIVLDEMGKFDPHVTRPAVVNRMLDLTFDGVIDHAFLIDNDAEFYDEWRDSLDVLVYEVGASEVVA